MLSKMASIVHFHLDDPEIFKQLKKYLLISLVLHLVAAFFSRGFYHFDEYFQIFEFLNLKMGSVQPDQLPWEYHHKLRSFFMPAFFYGILKPLSALGVDSPFLWTFIARLTSAILGWLSSFIFVLLAIKFVKTKRYLVWATLILLFNWFTIFLHVRHSSESWSASLISLGIGLFLLFLPPDHERKERRVNIPITTSLIIGALMGFAFLARFQVGLMIFPFFLWCRFIGNISFKTLFIIGHSILIIIFFGAFIDYWGYGEWTFTPWNYFETNLLKGAVNTFGRSPWYYYLTKSITRGIPPYSLLLFGVTFLFVYKKPLHLLTWMIIPFLLIHSMIGHKELRFIFPIIQLTPLLLVLSLDELLSRWNLSKYSKLIKVFVVINYIILGLTLIRPANRAISFYNYVYHNPVENILSLGGDPFQMVGLRLNFYMKNPVRVFEVKKVSEVKVLLRRGNEARFVFVNNLDDYRSIDKMENCQASYKSAIHSFPFLLKIAKTSRAWALFNCEPLKE